MCSDDKHRQQGRQIKTEKELHQSIYHVKIMAGDSSIINTGYRHQRGCIKWKNLGSTVIHRVYRQI
jgi:hypothetical protein